MSNLRVIAMKELAASYLNQDPIQSIEFIKEVLYRVSDMDLFALYYEKFGHAVGSKIKLGGN